MQLYVPDPELSSTRVLLDLSQMRPWFQRLLNCVGDFSVSISAIRYKPGTSCVVSYRICQNGAVTFAHAKAFHTDDWAVRKQKLCGLEPAVLIDDEFSFALFRFPLDAEIPSIQLFENDPQSFLSRVFFSRYGTQVPLAVVPLAYKPNRRLTVRLDTESGERFALKLHDPSTFDQVLQSARALKESRFDLAPKRVGRSRRHHAMIYRWVDGQKVDFASLNLRQTGQMLESVFGYLDCLHASVVPSNHCRTDAESNGGIDSIANYLAAIYPPCGIRARAIADFILHSCPGSGLQSFVHGDFHEGQLVEYDGEIRACDFDNCGTGDATSDIANFVAHLQLKFCQDELPRNVIDFVQESVVKQISFTRHLTRPDQYRWNRIASLFRLITHPFRSGSDSWTEQVDRILDLLEGQIREARKSFGRWIPADPVGAAANRTMWSGQQCQAGREDQLPSLAIQEDPGLAFLSPLFDPATAQKEIWRKSPDLVESLGGFEVQEIVCRRIKPGRRCLIEFVLSTERGLLSILGKASAKRLDRQAYEMQTSLEGDFGFGSGCADGIFVPRPLGVLPSWKMWLQEKVPGDPASQYMTSGQLDRIAGQIAASIAKLHNSKLQPRKTHCVSDELRILRDRLTLVANDLPVWSDRIHGVVRDCESIAKTIDESKTVPIHRDFYQEQILFGESCTWLVDLDLVSFGHPALDVGNFLAHLTEHAIRKHDNPDHWYRETAGITHRYLELMPNVSAREIRTFEAISLARHLFISWSRPARKEFVEKLLTETERRIDAVIQRRHSQSTFFSQPCLEF